MHKYIIDINYIILIFLNLLIPFLLPRIYKHFHLLLCSNSHSVITLYISSLHGLPLLLFPDVFRFIMILGALRTMHVKNTYYTINPTYITHITSLCSPYTKLFAKSERITFVYIFM